MYRITVQKKKGFLANSYYGLKKRVIGDKCQHTTPWKNKYVIDG